MVWQKCSIAANSLKSSPAGHAEKNKRRQFCEQTLHCFPDRAGCLHRLGFALKKNVGLIAVLAAAVFGSAAGYTDSQIIKGSNQHLHHAAASRCCAPSLPTTVRWVAAKVSAPVRRPCGHHSGHHVPDRHIVAAIGPAVPALGIAAALSLPLGKSTGYNSVMLAAIGQIGSMAGRFSPITPESVLIYNLASEQGITEYQTHTLIYATITTIVLSIVIFFVFKGFRIKEPQNKEKESLPAITQKQIITLVGFLAMIVASAFFKRNVGLISFAVAVVLLLLNVADEKVVIKSVPDHPADGHRHRHADEHCL
ncbi:MAG: hypothetical protein ACLUIR_06005 [Faecalibacterium prausnitzii]